MPQTVLQHRNCQSSCVLQRTNPFDTSVSSHRERTTPPLVPQATVIVSALRRHHQANPLRDWRGVQLARRSANGLMKINLRQDFMTSAMLVIAVLIEQFPDNRQLTLWSSCSTTIALFFWPHTRRTASRQPSSGLFSNGHSNLENALVVDLDDPSAVGREERTAQQTSLMAHTSSLRLVYREFTERVLKVSCQSGFVPARLHWHRCQSIPRHFYPEDHEVRRLYPRGNVHLRRGVGRHNHIPKLW